MPRPNAFDRGPLLLVRALDQPARGYREWKLAVREDWIFARPRHWRLRLAWCFVRFAWHFATGRAL